MVWPMHLLTCILVADQFWHTFEKLSENDHQYQNAVLEARDHTDDPDEAVRIVENTGIKGTGIPAIVNIAFASELYLKAYLVATGSGWSKGHEVRKLFERLKPDAKKALFVHLYGNGVENTEANVLRRLDHNNKAFEVFRYFHEVPDEASYMTGFARNLCTSLQALLAPYKEAELKRFRDKL
jgi:hypothetical protein